MSEQEIEKNLEYGDCFNFFGTLSSLFMEVVGNVEKIIDKSKKKN